MELTYQINKEFIELTETEMETDVEFEIRVLAEAKWAGMKKIQKFFEEDRVYTDVLFYAYENHRFRVIVRKDYYVDFILALMKHRFIESAAWS
ncbi:hypothetical protein [Paenibacillus wynnii]|uniref:Uncharacterized protein n=1 Tax=Paenibacillus wynnii TaxID=268407 RepID=A0A098M422_9BACL|nr:hypothetical protein [Paenibacillus wynnii]KGE16796.1 hypothetical protein PWYN_19060 [Paenibacillus wynnii]